MNNDNETITRKINAEKCCLQHESVAADHGTLQHIDYPAQTLDSAMHDHLHQPLNP